SPTDAPASSHHTGRHHFSQRTQPTDSRAPSDSREVRRADQRTVILSERLGRKRGTFVGGILIVSPLRGARTARAARWVTTKVPKPLMVTRRPLRSDSKMPPTKAAMAFSAEAFEPRASLAMIATRSAFVTPPLYAREADAVNSPHDAMRRA